MTRDENFADYVKPFFTIDYYKKTYVAPLFILTMPISHNLFNSITMKKPPTIV